MSNFKKDIIGFIDVLGDRGYKGVHFDPIGYTQSTIRFINSELVNFATLCHQKIVNTQLCRRIG